MKSIAKVVIEISLNQEFDYKIPDHLIDHIKPGSQVRVPFHGRNLRGFVVGLSDSSSFKNQLKEIDQMVGDKPFIPDSIIKLAYWISEYYCSPIESSIKAVLPSIIRKRGVSHKTQLGVSLIKTPDKKYSFKQQKIIDLLRNNGILTLKNIQDKLKCSVSPIRTLEKQGIVKIESIDIRRKPSEILDLIPTDPFKLMKQQEDALENIISEIDRNNPCPILLNGVTGSGKTEVYLQAIQYALSSKRGAIVLVPEIALTPQTVERFQARFGDTVAVLHSNLSDGERHDEWHRIYNGLARIVIGARSALFAPVDNLGLIVVDEEHEPTYKQEESPRYHARDVAVMRAKIEKCCVVLGSATPSLESSSNVRKGKYKDIRMLKRIDHRHMPFIHIVNMKIESEKGPTLFSNQIVDGIRDRLNKGEQIILFLNRRGFSSTLSCEKCGYTYECNQCSVTRNFHKFSNKLICHICGSEEHPPSVCQKCNSPVFEYKGSGTEKIDEVLHKLFSSARIARMDSDTMRNKDAYQKTLDSFKLGKIDILIGTQMIAKGLDFPNVTMVGVLNADISLNVPDFRAGERTFQLLTQVAGRAGRGDVKGEVFIQTYTPNHPAIMAAKKLDPSLYAEEDLAFRKEMKYPPYSHLVLITFKGKDEYIVSHEIQKFTQYIKNILSSDVILSLPIPAPLAVIKNDFRYQVNLRCEHVIRMIKPIQLVLSKISFSKKVRIIIDVDAISLS